MKLRLTAFLAAVLLSATAAAQTSFGVRLGYNSTNIRYEIANQEVDTDGQGNLMLGAFVNLPVGTNLISIQPEINYMNRGFEIGGRTITVGGQSLTLDGGKQTISFLDLGALLRLNFNMDGPVGIYVGAGPYLTYAVSGSIEDGNGDRDIDFDADRVKRGGTQVAGIGGVTFGAGGLNFFAEGRYQTALSNLSDDDNFDIRQRLVGVAVGLMVPLN